MNKILIALKEDIENGLTLMEIKAAMMHIMADSGYNDEGTQARINNFVTRKRNEITSMKKNHKKRRISEVINSETFSLCIFNFNF
jgi:hypothetical protein